MTEKAKVRDLSINDKTFEFALKKTYLLIEFKKLYSNLYN